MTKKQKIIVSITGIFLVLLILVGLTYAYFLTRIVGNTNDKSISVTTANLELVYGDGTTELLTSDTKLEPSADPINTKDFTVTNNGDDTTYVVMIENVRVKVAGTENLTTFESNDFVYTLSCEKSDGTSCNGVDTQTTLPMSDSILVENDIVSGDTHTYEITVWYLDTGADQSADMNKTLEARINIEGKEDIEEESNINPYSDNTNSLAYNIINNAINVTEEQNTLGYAIYSATPLTTPAEEVSGENESTLSMTPDDYTATTKNNSYYYRGNVKNNYLEFNGMCWRIVRIEGDGSIKITLAKQDLCSTITDTDTGSAFIGTGDYGYIANNAYADYENSENKTTSMKYKFDEWFNTNMSTVSNKLKSTQVCIGDTTIKYSYDGTVATQESLDAIYAEKGFYEWYYETYIRLNVNKTTTLICDIEDKTISSYQIYPLTADEITFAGINNIYLGDNASSNSYWLSNVMYYGHGVSSDDSAIANTTSISYDSVNLSEYSLRPALSLIEGIEISGGIGTIDKPYIVE